MDSNCNNNKADEGSDVHQGTECNIEDVCDKLDTVNIHEDEKLFKLAAESHDEKLFKQPPPADDCPICFLLLPSLDPTGSKYMTCCGKRICSGCIHAPLYDDQGNKINNKKCPFCRTPDPSLKESIKRLKKRIEAGDPIAILNHGYYHHNGTNGYPQDYTKAFELFHRAAKLGYAKAYLNIGVAYDFGRGVEVDNKKATHYYELAAMKGDATARCNLGKIEAREGNIDRAGKHFIIAVRSGSSDSLDIIKQLYSMGHATKDDYTEALRAYQTYLGEIKSRPRDEAAASHDGYRYY